MRGSNSISRERPDLIYERYSQHTLCGIWAASRHGIPIVLVRLEFDASKVHVLDAELEARARKLGLQFIDTRSLRRAYL